MSRRAAITEAVVRAAARAGGTVAMSPGQIVTPSARDLARDLGVLLVPGAAAPGPQGAAASPAPAAGPTIALGCDHGGFPLKRDLAAVLESLGYRVLDCGTTDTAAVDYPDHAVAVARAVASGQAACGIMVDGAGIGSAMAANKIAGVRAALCYDLTTARNAREHNDANVLTLGGTLIGLRLATEIVTTFLATPFGGGRHALRVDKINRLDAPRT